MRRKKPRMYDPKKPFGDLSRTEQRGIQNFLRSLEGASTPAAAYKIATGAPQKMAWLRAQATERQNAALLRAVQDMTPAQRQALGLPKEAGPPRWRPPTVEEKIADADKLHAVYMKNTKALEDVKDLASQGRTEAAQKRMMEGIIRQEDYKEVRAVQLSKKMQKMIAEGQEESHERALEYQRVEHEERQKLLHQGMLETHKLNMALAKEMSEYQNRLFQLGEWVRKGRPEVQAAIQLMGGVGNWNWPAVEDAIEKGLWGEVRRVMGPEALVKASKAWMDYEYGWVPAAVTGPYGKIDWKAAQKLGLTQSEWDIVGFVNPDFGRKWVAAGGELRSPVSLINLVEAGEQLRPRVGPEPRYLKVEGLPGMEIPVPKAVTPEVGRSLQLEIMRRRPAGAPEGLRVGRRAVERGIRLGAPLPEARPPIYRKEVARLVPELAPVGARLPEVVKAGPPARLPKEAGLGRGEAAIGEIVGLGLQSGVIPPASPLAQVYGAVSMGAAAKSILIKYGGAQVAALAGPIGWAIGIATLLSGFSAARKAREKRRKARAAAAAAGAARAIQYQVGYVPSRLREFQRLKPRRGAQRPFVPVFPSRLGLAATTPTPPARI